MSLSSFMDRTASGMDRATGFMQKFILFCGVAVAFVGVMWKSMKALFRAGKAIDQIGRMYRSWDENGGEDFYRRQNELHAKMMPPGGKCVMDLVGELQQDVKVLKQGNKQIDADNKTQIDIVKRVDEKVNTISQQITDQPKPL